MAFSYTDLSRIETKISADADELSKVLQTLNSLIEDNVGNVTTWNSAKAAEFKNKWQDFANEKFPRYEESFKAQVKILDTAIKSYQQAEQ